MDNYIQPKPMQKGKIITYELIEWIQKQQSKEMTVKFDINDNTKQETIKLIKLRDEFGVKKYGQHLMSEDGRKTAKDALDELGDLLQYVYKAVLLKDEETFILIKKIIPILLLLLNDNE